MVWWWLRTGVAVGVGWRLMRMGVVVAMVRWWLGTGVAVGVGVEVNEEEVVVVKVDGGSANHVYHDLFFSMMVVKIVLG